MNVCFTPPDELLTGDGAEVVAKLTLVNNGVAEVAIKETGAALPIIATGIMPG